ncbi:dolichol-phosphate mannosyltransferase [Thermosulfidibacter takaii ABI70S6]|uniref:Dolichol-phosphate mannosyltransferase n=1 Tax=Thermosulfidibacter takaii (strain DSM 17441 / JCM 13301 / NBRC 103674 / ABI70S6) TaxID=1298851 RepID=A0A0S3QTV9_THET7|nr:glycosyltransferase family 2 protein [Thermosulfidibacter takaii]BAT71745.1 dolichol-phosphate mannosyltransferase [Thermosulfidibacter takaii ABI70S6]
MKISIVIPIYNEEENIRPLYKELKEVLNKMENEYEIIFVNDGSTDGSEKILDELAKENPNVKVIHFRRNFGQTAAISAGFRYATGDVIITMDGDLQNDPADIPKLLEKIEEGYDLVSGWRRDRKDPYWTRVFPSKMANKLISLVTGVNLHDYGCSLKAYKKEVIKDLHLYGEQHRFIPALASELGCKITEIPVNHRPRTAGKSKYGLSRTIKVLLDLIVIKFLLFYKAKPMRVFGGIGGLLLLMGFFPFSYLILYKIFTGAPIGHRPLLVISAVFMLAGLQLFCLGILGELIIRLYYEGENREPYHVKRTVNLE